MANRTNTNTDSKAGGAKSTRARGAKKFGGMEVSALAKQLGMPGADGVDIVQLQDFLVGQRGMSPEAFAAMMKSKNGATQVIAQFGAQTETAQQMDFVSPEISETTGGRPGDAARAARAQLSEQIDPDAPADAVTQARFQGANDAMQMAGVDMGPSIDISASGVRPTPTPRKPKGEKGSSGTTDAAGGDGGKPPVEATTDAAGDGEGQPNPGGDQPQPAAGGRRRRFERPPGGYVLGALRGTAKAIGNEIPGLAGVGAMYGLYDYLNKGSMSQALGLRSNQEDDERAAAQAILRQMEGAQYGNQDAQLWGLGTPTPQNPAGSMASDAAIVPTSPPPDGAEPQLVPNRFMDTLNRMGTIGGRQ